MARRTFPRTEEHHRVVAAEVLERHAMRSGKPVTLPVPIENIIESTFELEVLWDHLDEPPETVILGALLPAQRRIIMNEHPVAFGKKREKRRDESVVERAVYARAAVIALTAVVGVSGAVAGCGGSTKTAASSGASTLAAVRGSLIAAGATCPDLLPPATDNIDISGAKTVRESKCTLNGVEVDLTEYASPVDRRKEEVAGKLACGFLPKDVPSFSYFAAGSWIVTADPLDVEHVQAVNAKLTDITHVKATTVDCKG